MMKGKVGDASDKLTKAQKKRLKLQKQQQEFEKSLKGKHIQTVAYNNPDSVTAKQIRQSKREQVNDKDNDETEVKSGPGVEIDMRKTRYEIMKFGINSLHSKELEDAETTLAISLGARPKKRPAINYKELQEQRKKERELEKEQESMTVKPKLAVVMKKKPHSDRGKKNARKEKIQKQGGGRSLGRSSKQPRRRK